MATYLPQTLDELRLISGFGDVKLARYGREFLIPVKNYCAKNGLTSQDKTKIAKTRAEGKNRMDQRIQIGLRIPRRKLYIYTGQAKPLQKLLHSAACNTTIEGHLSYYIYKGEMDVQEMVSEEKKP